MICAQICRRGVPLQVKPLWNRISNTNSRGTFLISLRAHVQSNCCDGLVKKKIRTSSFIDALGCLECQVNGRRRRRVTEALQKARRVFGLRGAHRVSSSVGDNHSRKILPFVGSIYTGEFFCVIFLSRAPPQRERNFALDVTVTFHSTGR